MNGLRRRLPPATPLVILSFTVMALAWVQFRWLDELRVAARERMGRHLRVAVQAVTTEMSLELIRLAAAMEQAGTDSAARSAAWTEWQASALDIGDLFEHPYVRPAAAPAPLRRLPPLEIDIGRLPAGAIVFPVDSVRLADSLVVRLARRIARSAELDVALSLVYYAPDGRVWTFGRTGDSVVAAPDIVVPLLSIGSQARVVFYSGLPTDDSARYTASGPRVTWSADSGQSPAPIPLPPSGWRLQAWHGAGSLERAARHIQYRNLAIGFGLIAVLTAVGGLTLAALRRHARLAEDRAAILAGISHEVRTPLAVIRSAAENLAGGLLRRPGEVIEYGQLMESEAGKLERTIEGALAFARAAHGQGEEREVVDLAELTREIVRDMDQAHRVTINASGAPRAVANRSAIGIAIRNLVANAVGYSPPDAAVMVTLSADGSTARITVVDRGPGVPAAEREKIFEPFFRGSAALKLRRPGLGLGLALAHRVAAIHRGRLWLDSTPGSGAVFHFDIPAA